MENQVRTSRGRIVFASVLLGVAGLLAAASSTQPATSPRYKPPPTYVPSGPEPPTVQLKETHYYRGGHPIHPDYGHGWCNAAGSHTHVYAPFEPELFTLVNAEWVFCGDPADFEYDGPVYWYANPHPFEQDYGDAWCYYPWPHRHAFSIAAEGFNVVGGIIYFVGQFTDSFYRLLSHKRDFFGRHYRRRYLRGSLYRRHLPRYARLGPGRYRVLRPRSAYRPYRPPLRRRPDRTPGVGNLTRLPRTPMGSLQRRNVRPHSRGHVTSRRLPNLTWRRHRRLRSGRGFRDGRAGHPTFGRRRGLRGRRAFRGSRGFRGRRGVLGRRRGLRRGPDGRLRGPRGRRGAFGARRSRSRSGAKSRSRSSRSSRSSRASRSSRSSGRSGRR